MDTKATTSVIEFSPRAGFLALGGVDLIEGEVLQVEVAGRWTVVQVRELEATGWIGLPCSTRGRPVLVHLHPGVRARRVG